MRIFAQRAGAGKKRKEKNSLGWWMGAKADER